MEEEVGGEEYFNMVVGGNLGGSEWEEESGAYAK
jgi:hypothetical protein